MEGGQEVRKDWGEERKQDGEMERRDKRSEEGKEGRMGGRWDGMKEGFLDFKP